MPVIVAKLEARLLELQLGQIRDSRDHNKTNADWCAAIKHYPDFQRTWLQVVSPYRNMVTNKLEMTPEQEPIAINDCVDKILVDFRWPTKQLIEDMNDAAMEYVKKTTRRRAITSKRSGS